MSTPLIELEGTTEDIQRRLDVFAGQRLHVTVQPLGASSAERQVPNDPQLKPTTPLRPVGLCQGQFTVPESFFEPLPD